MPRPQELTLWIFTTDGSARTTSGSVSRRCGPGPTGTIRSGANGSR